MSKKWGLLAGLMLATSVAGAQIPYSKNKTGKEKKEKETISCTDDLYTYYKQLVLKNIGTEVWAEVEKKLEPYEEENRKIEVIKKEKEEIQRHFLTAKETSHSSEELVQKVSDIFRHDIQKHIYDAERAHPNTTVQKVFDTFSAPELWQGKLEVQDVFLGNSDFVLIEVSGIHEVEGSLTKAVQDEIAFAKEIARENGCEVFGQELVRNREIDAHLPLYFIPDTINGRNYDKKIMLDFESKHPEVLTLGIEEEETREEFNRVYIEFQTFQEFCQQIQLPMGREMYLGALKQFSKSLQAVQEKEWGISINPNGVVSTVDQELPTDLLVTKESQAVISGNLFKNFKHWLYTKRSQYFIDNMQQTFQNRNRKDLVLLYTAGAQHFQNIPGEKSALDFCKERGITYIHLVPKALQSSL